MMISTDLTVCQVGGLIKRVLSIGFNFKILDMMILEIILGRFASVAVDPKNSYSARLIQGIWKYFYH